MNREYVEGYWGTTQDWEAFRDSYFPQDENAKAHERSRWFAELAASFAPGSVLEVGCNCGRNLFHLKRRCPGVLINGLDLNGDALAFAATKVPGRFQRGSILDSGRLFQEKFDLVFTMAVLIHVAPADIRAAVAQIAALGRKTMILCEYDGAGTLLSGRAENAPSWRVNNQYLWTHDFTGILADLGLRYRKLPMPEPLLDVGLKDVLIVDL